MISRCPDADAACEVRCDGGTIGPARPAAADRGTTVTVRDLFFNTPARRKFMRTANTEFGHIAEQLARLALPHRNVAFTLTHNRRCTHRLPPAETLRRRAADFFGPELADAMIEFADEEPQLNLYGLIAPPAHARASTKWQYFFVNGRYVRDRLLAHAVREACRGLVDPSRAPVALVFLEMDPSLVDVNVHPAKVEVRFRNGQMVHSQLLAALREAHNRADLAPQVQIRQPAAPAPGGTGELPDDARRASLKQALADFLGSQPAPQRGLDFPSPPQRPAPGVPGRARLPPLAAADRTEPPAPPLPRPAIQIHNSYIVSETEDGLVIIDQHALHERVIFEELTRRVSSGPLSAQRLLIPATVEVTASEKACLTERAALLDRLGIEITEFGPQSVAVQKVPALLAERPVPPGELLRELLDLLAEHAEDDAEQLLQQVLAAIACRAAVKAGEALSPEEITALLGRRDRDARGGSCPHGRPTTLNLTLHELDKQFKRT